MYHVAALLSHPEINYRPHPFWLRSYLRRAATFCLTPPSVTSVLHFVPSSLSCLSAALLANLSIASFPWIPIWLFTQLRHTALLSFLHLFVMRFAASLIFFVLPYPLFSILIIPAIAAFESLSISRLSSLLIQIVSVITATSMSHTVVIVLSALPPWKSFLTVRRAAVFPSPPLYLVYCRYTYTCINEYQYVLLV